MKVSHLIYGDVEVTVDETGNVNVDGAKSVEVALSGKTEDGFYNVVIGSHTFDFDIVLTVAGSTRPLALVVDQDGVVFAQDGVGSWEHRYQLFPTPSPPNKQS